MMDPKLVADLVARDRQKLLDRIESSLEVELRKMAPHEALGFRLLRGQEEVRRVKASATRDYAGIVFSFMRGNKYDGYDVDSLVTPVALKCVEDAIIEFYSSEEVSHSIVNEVIRQVGDHAIPTSLVSGEISANLRWLQREATALNTETASSLASQAIDVSVEQIQAFMASSAGKAILAAIAKAASTSAGKIALQKMMLLTVQKIMASTALKSTIVSIIKKIGVSVLIKTAVGKVVISLLALVGIANVPVAWIAIPIIAGFLVYEYSHFPEKLSKKLPKQIREGVNSGFMTMNEQIVSAIIKNLLDSLERQLFRSNAA